MTSPVRSKTISPRDVAHLHEQGMSQRSIADQLGVSRRQVRKAGLEAGVVWDRSGTAAATRARQAAALEVRAVLAEKWGEAAVKSLDFLLDETLSPSERQSNAVIAGIATQRVLEVQRHQAALDGQGEGSEMIEELEEFAESFRQGVGGSMGLR